MDGILLKTVPMKANELKEVLTEIKKGNRAWEGESKVSIVKSMVEHIGSTDSELRDSLIYSSFFQLIVDKNEIGHDLLNELLEVCLNGLLMKGIGESETDTVFTRSFTTLLIALILYRDNEDNFLNQNKVYQIKDKLIEYINLEKDLRGYIAVKGWAHSIAHVSDAFEELAKSQKINQGMYLEILKPLWSKAFVSHSVYVHDEDERILIPILHMLNNGLDPQEIEVLLESLPKELKTRKEQIEEEKYWFLYANCKTFLKSFYMKINGNSNYISLQKSIEMCLAEI